MYVYLLYGYVSFLGYSFYVYRIDISIVRYSCVFGNGDRVYCLRRIVYRIVRINKGGY